MECIVWCDRKAYRIRGSKSETVDVIEQAHHREFKFVWLDLARIQVGKPEGEQVSLAIDKISAVEGAETAESVASRGDVNITVAAGPPTSRPMGERPDLANVISS